MMEMEYENHCEMISVIDRPIEMKTVVLITDIIDGKQRTHTDWNSMDFKKYIVSGNNEIPQPIKWQ